MTERNSSPASPLPARWLRGSLALLALAAGIAGPLPARAQTQADEIRVKAAFLYKFGAYIEWPQESFEGPESPLTIGVMAADRLAEELAQIAAGRSVNGRPVLVRRLRPGNPVKGLHVLFIGEGGGDRLPEILAAARGRPLLTVTESEAGIELGSVINFVIIEDRVRFDVAPPAAASGKLRISARLLAVARRVVSRPS